MKEEPRTGTNRHEWEGEDALKPFDIRRERRTQGNAQGMGWELVSTLTEWCIGVVGGKVIYGVPGIGALAVMTGDERAIKASRRILTALLDAHTLIPVIMVTLSSGVSLC